MEIGALHYNIYMTHVNTPFGQNEDVFACYMLDRCGQRFELLMTFYYCEFRKFIRRKINYYSVIFHQPDLCQMNFKFHSFIHPITPLCTVVLVYPKLTF